MSLKGIVASSFFVFSVVLGLPAENSVAKDLELLEKSELVDAITSVQQVKGALKRVFAEYDQCMIGSCFEDWSFTIAELVGALDVRTGKITGETKPNKDSIAISDNDLKLFRLLWENCHPTNYQYWHYGSILHVSYEPSKEADKEIRQWLNIKSKRK